MLSGRLKRQISFKSVRADETQTTRRLRQPTVFLRNVEVFLVALITSVPCWIHRGGLFGKVYGVWPRFLIRTPFVEWKSALRAR